MAHKTNIFKPVYWSILIFIIAEALVLGVAAREDVFLAANNIYVPGQPSQGVSLWPGTVVSGTGEVIQTSAYSSLGPILIYFFAMIIVVGIVLYLIPVSALKVVFRALFAFLFAWGVFVISVMWLPLAAAIAIAAAVGLGWFFFNKVWLQNLVMILAMVGLGAVFGRFITPWTAMILLLVLAVYDFLAVRFGYMLWMANKMGQFNALPAFVIPRRAGGWRSDVEQYDLSKEVELGPPQRTYSILGGGDIGFPLLLSASVYFASGLNSAIMVAFFSLLGLIGAYWLQGAVLKGKPIPALPPIATMSLVGLLIVL